jgi:hypothetical protein
LRIAEDQQLRGRHSQSHLCRFSAVIDQCKQVDSFRLQKILESVHRFVDRMIARDFDNALLFLDGNPCSHRSVRCRYRGPRQNQSRDDKQQIFYDTSPSSRSVAFACARRLLPASFINHLVSLLLQLNHPDHGVGVDLYSRKKVRIAPVVGGSSSATQLDLHTPLHQAGDELSV